MGYILKNNGLNIWHQDSRQVAVSYAVQTFSLTVSHGSSSQVISLNDSFYYFTAPKDASPCEVYNFSVTATYVGATYTGAGCSVPSPVLSMMLPSLPNICKLKDSIKFNIGKLFSQLILDVSFKPASSCEQYPIANYSMEVKGPLPEEALHYGSDLDQTFKITFKGNLSENAVYSFRVFVANSFGTSTTNNYTFYTTDVQTVRAQLDSGHNIVTATCQCTFIKGSNASGCMVVLTYLYGEESHILKRNKTTNKAMSTIRLNYSQSCYQSLKAFDVESDGVIGSLAVPGTRISTVLSLSYSSLSQQTVGAAAEVAPVLGGIPSRAANDL